MAESTPPVTVQLVLSTDFTVRQIVEALKRSKPAAALKARDEPLACGSMAFTMALRTSRGNLGVSETACATEAGTLSNAQLNLCQDRPCTHLSLV